MGGSATRVLIVDDEENQRLGLANMVSGWGYQAQTASDGVDALEKLASFPADVMVTDLMMPRMDGWEFRRAQKHDPEVSRIPVVVLSALGPDSLDAEGYVGKPFDVDELVSAVRRYASRPVA